MTSARWFSRSTASRVRRREDDAAGDDETDEEDKDDDVHAKEQRMSLPVPVLDDRKFQDIGDQAKRLIPLYCRE